MTHSTAEPDAPPPPAVPPTPPGARERFGRSVPGPFDGIGSRDGLVAVTVGMLSVTILAGVTLFVIRDGSDAAPTVAIATSAFGAVSALVGAFLGIKIGTEQTQDLAQGAQRDAQAANARASVLETYVPLDSKSDAGASADQAAAKAGEASGRRRG